jgi:hypothetical protein
LGDAMKGFFWKKRVDARAARVRVEPVEANRL